jgi:RHS repeat-associated protein
MPFPPKHITTNANANFLGSFRSKGSVSGVYEYRFNGQEKDDEVYGIGNSYTAEFWEYDPRLGRRWNNDPVIKEWESPYATFANNPIWFVDANGLDTVDIIKNEKGKWEISKTQIVKGDDVFRVKVGDETKTYTFSEGEYGKRFNVLNLESKGDNKTGYTLGIYHISGQEGEGATGYTITPG